MKFKLDENVPEAVAEVISRAGHKAATVRQQNLSGVDDSHLIMHCLKEKTCLVTLDLDFGNPFAYPPQKYSGIIVLRHPHPSVNTIRNLLKQVMKTLKRARTTGNLWIVEPGRIRIFGGE